MQKSYDLAIVGGGIAGYSAALTANSLRLDFIWLGGFTGGKIEKAEVVRNYPAFTGDGKALSAALLAQAEKENLSALPVRVNGVYDTGEGYTLLAGEESFSARTVILATGVESAGKIKGEREFLGRGVSYCAVCDGALYKGKRVAAVLSSARYAEEAEYLAGFAEKVYRVCPSPLPEAKAENIQTVRDIPVAVEGDMRVKKLILKGEEIAVDGVFFLRDSAPPESLAGGLETEGAHIKVNRDMSTNLKGLFAAGDVTGTPYQFIKAAGEGCVAAFSARAYLNETKAER